MSEANAAMLKRWFEEVWNQRRKETIFELFATNGISHGADDTGAQIQGPAGFLPFYERICGAFPDIKIKIEDCFASGNKAVLRWSGTMTHHGDHLGIPATRKPVALSGISIARIANGQIAEAWDQWDKLAMLQQIGISAPTQTSAAAST